MKQLITTIAGKYLNTLALVAPKAAGRHGFNLFCYPYRAPLKEYHREFLQSANRFTLQLENIPIQGYRWGQGSKKVLFVHGWQSHSFRWKNYIKSLPKDTYTMYALDAPGHGFSKGRHLNVPLYSRLIKNFVEEKGPFEAVVSHSIGSFSALHALYEQPALAEAFGKLVLMASPAKALDFIHFYRDTLKLSDKVLQLTLQHFEKTIQKPVGYFSAPQFATGLKLPGLIIHDREDLEAPYATAQVLQQVWKNSRLITTQGLAHNLRSPEVVEAVRAFIVEEGTGVTVPGVSRQSMTR